MGAGFQATTPSLPYAPAMFMLLIPKPGTPTETISLSSDIHRPRKKKKSQLCRKEPARHRDTQTHQVRNKKAKVPNLSQLDDSSSPWGSLLAPDSLPTHPFFCAYCENLELISGYETPDSEILRASITPQVSGLCKQKLPGFQEAETQETSRKRTIQFPQPSRKVQSCQPHHSSPLQSPRI